MKCRIVYLKWRIENSTENVHCNQGEGVDIQEQVFQVDDLNQEHAWLVERNVKGNDWDKRNKRKHCGEGGQNVNRHLIMQNLYKAIQNRKPLVSFEQRRHMSGLHFIASLWFSIENKLWRKQECNQLKHYISISDGDSDQNSNSRGVKRKQCEGGINMIF